MRQIRGVALGGAAVLAVLLIPAQAPASASRAATAGSSLGDTTISANRLRTGWDPGEPELSPDDVTAASFGPLFATQLHGGQIYAQPLVVNRTQSSPGTLIVATEDNNVYGLDPVDGGKRWHTTLGTPWSASVLQCGDLTADIGVTSTPVYDPSTDIAYVMSKEAPHGRTSTDPRWYLHALSAETGLERSGWPVRIGGHPNNDRTRTFNAETAAQRPGLLLLNGVVYAGFASYCDHGPYVGYVVGVSTKTAKRTAMFSTTAGTSTGEAGIWQSGGGLVSDGHGQIIVTTGNGDTAPVAPSNAPPAVLSEAVVRLTVKANGTLKATDWFSPSNGATLNQWDADLGSGGPMAIPNAYGTASFPHLLVQIGKDGRLFLLDRDKLGGNSQGPGGGDDVLGVTQLAHGVWGHPAFWGGSPGTSSAGGYVYVADATGLPSQDPGHLVAFKLGHNSQGKPVLVSTASSEATFGYTSGSPVVTSDGTTAGTALVWVESVDNVNGTNPVLHAFKADPVNGVLVEVYSAPLDPPGVTDGSHAHGAKFATVATDNGRVYTTTRDGVVFGFGHPSAAPITAPRTDLGSVPIGETSAPVGVTLTATKGVTVTGVSASAPYTVTDPPGGDVVMNTNDTLNVHVTMQPTEPGDQTGTLTVMTNDPTAPAVSFGLGGYGTQAGLSAYPASVDFGTVALPGHNTQGINIVNTSGVDETISSVSTLTAPFSSADLPTVNQLVPAGASLAIPLDYAPTAASSGDAEALSIGVDSDAEILTVDLTGDAVSGHAKLVLTPKSLHFGLVPRGHALTKTFEIGNQGNILLTLNKAKAPFGAFISKLPVSEGQQLTPGQSVVQSVTFKPIAKGKATAAYQISGSDGSGVHNETLFGTDDQLMDRYLHHHPLAVLLGKSTSNTRRVGAGYRHSFAHGQMFWSHLNGVHEMHGAILRRYHSIGGPAGPAGYPLSDVTRVAPGGQRTAFRHGWAIYWSHRSGAWAVHGRLGGHWRALGAQHSTYGYPTSNQFAIDGGIRQRFQHAVMTWRPHVGYRMHRLSR